MPTIFGRVPWKHHVEIFTKSQSLEEALYYINKVAEEGWSRSWLEDQIAAKLFLAQGSAITNFDKTLPNPQTYWRVLKNRLKKEGNETVTNCNALKLRAADGKMRMTDVADTEQIFRLIQSIPSPKAEPFKRWMAQVEAEANIKDW